ncbi:MAG: protein kinase [Candidatus Contendobacter sp.]
MTAPSEETRAQPVEVTCPGCFHPREWDVAGVCPICHYRAGLEGRSGALLPVGTQLKGYVVGEKLGQGGFGITYRGFDVTLKMKVAIKEYYPSELVGRSTDRKTVVLNTHDHEDLFHYGLRTFLQEAQTVAQLRHPHLVRVLNFFELNDTAYLVMDYYEGEDLARHLKPPKGLGGQPMPWRRALKLLLPVLDGLRKVHQAGFMHRDFKPGNLYLTQDDDLILLDFGSARQVTGTHTRSLLIFSEGYAPYEQYLQGHLNRQGPWTDVYGAAATLYFMLTARRLPSAPDRRDSSRLQQPDLLKPARHWVPDVPEALDAALLRALAVEPEQRLQSIAEFKRQLEAVLTEEEPTRPKPPPQPKVDPTPLPRPKAASNPPIQPEPVSASSAKPARPTAPPKATGTAKPSATPKSRRTVVAIAVIGLMAPGGWWLWMEFRVAPKSPATPVVVAPPVVTPPVTESPPPVAEPRAYLTVRADPATAQIQIMNIGSGYRDGIELTPGDFDLEVSAPGYQTYRGWRTLVAGVQEIAVVLQPNPPVSPPVAPVAPPVIEPVAPAAPAPSPDDIARQQQLDLQLQVAKELLEARKILAARRALDDAKPLDREGRVEAFRREQTTTMQATALVFLDQGQRTLAERVLNDLKQWDPQSPEYQALRERLARRR